MAKKKDNKERAQGFAALPQNKKEALILKALVATPGTPFETVCRNFGFTQEEYMATVQQSDSFGRDVVQMCIEKIVTPSIPAVMDTLSRRAMEGDPTFAKMFLQMIQALKQDEVNVSVYQHASDNELLIQLQQMTEELKGIKSEDD